MGTLFRRTVRRPVPAGATLTEKNGTLVARWKSRGKVRTAPVDVAAGGARTIRVETGTYYTRFRDYTGATVDRSTGCREETTARQVLARWEREAENIRSEVLDARALETARAAGGPIADAITAYEQALAAADVSGTYKASAVRAVRRLADELGFLTLRDIRRERV
jgi:hypothetical protein